VVTTLRHFISDFHRYRSSVISSLFRFHPAIPAYLKAKYKDVLNGTREPVSVHFRFNIEGVPDGHTSESRTTMQPDELWYLNTMQYMFDPSQSVFLLFSENAQQLQSFVLRLVLIYPGLSFIVIDENYALSLALMSMCKHHIVATSIFSFWGSWFQILLIDIDLNACRCISGSEPAIWRTDYCVSLL
jgi:hypothetical protein